MSCGRTSKCAHASAVDLMGESCVHGIAFGSPTRKANEQSKITCEVVNKRKGATREKKEKVSRTQDTLYRLFLKKKVY